MDPTGGAGNHERAERGGTPRSRGMAEIQEVYGSSVDPDQVEGPYTAFTVDHLFGTVWTGEALGIRTAA